MSAALHLARPDDLERLKPLVAAFHAHAGIEQSDTDRTAALKPLLEGSPHGAIYLIGPRRGPIGYIIVCFGYSVEMGGIDGFINEFYIRKAVRGRGMGAEVLRTLLPLLAEYGVRAIRLEVDDNNTSAKTLYARLGFKARKNCHLMTRKLV